MAKRQSDNVTKYTAKFSGHETFPLRYGWLYKAVKSVLDIYGEKPQRPVSSGNPEDIEKAVVRMGVGKNMVNSIRYWTDASKIIEERNGRDDLTEIALEIFGDDAESGWDPYMEQLATIWILHWQLNSNYKVMSASRWFFNRFNGQRFDKQQLMDSILSDVDKLNLKAAEKTISKDIECMLQGYSQKNSNNSKISEDSFSSPLVELGLIRTLEGGRYKKFSAELGGQESLPAEVFTFALIDYWNREAKKDKTISFDRLLTAEGSPARVFRLSQSALANRLDQVEELTQRKISWTDTQGLRQIQCDDIENLGEDKFDHLTKFYAKQGK
ncbi:DUF4007 family protein [Endozoicomonas sp. ISHI1]|uniref:DUF4007 family protein n=1 Tax=Endozoicomonas sp. ISHI1 TaxID=2825882 RepID=UPI00214830AD